MPSVRDTRKLSTHLVDFKIQHLRSEYNNYALADWEMRKTYNLRKNAITAKNEDILNQEEAFLKLENAKLKLSCMAYKEWFRKIRQEDKYKRLDTLHNEAQRKKTKEQFERILMLRNQEAFKCWFNKKSKSKWEWRNEQHKRKFN